MALRWKKNPLPKGLARVGCGPQGSILRDGDVEYATVYALRKEHRVIGWYWVTRTSAEMPRVNTCDEPVADEAMAKAAAMAFVRQQLQSAKSQG